MQLPRHSDESSSDTLNRLEVDHVVGPLRERVRGHESQVRMLGCAKEQRGHHAPSRVRKQKIIVEQGFRMSRYSRKEARVLGLDGIQSRNRWQMRKLKMA